MPEKASTSSRTVPRTAPRHVRVATFVEDCLGYCLDHGWIGADDLLAEFPLEQLMEALRLETDVRVRVLCDAAGVDERVAPLKSDAGAVEDLQLALLTGKTSSQAIVAAISIPGLVRALGTEAIWSFLHRTPFWTEGDARSQKRLRATLEAAAREGLVRGTFLLDPEVLRHFLSALPRPQLEEVVVRALRMGGEAQLSGLAESILSHTPLQMWLEHFGGQTVWQQVLEKELAENHGLSVAPSRPPPSIEIVDQNDTELERIHRPTEPFLSAVPSLGPVAPAPRVTVPACPAPPAPHSQVVESRLEEASGTSSSDMGLRLHLSTALEAVDRLPVRSHELPTSILLSLHSLYLDKLCKVASDDERALCYLEAFDSESELMTGLSALIEHLDARLNQAELARRQFDPWGLVQAVIVEERRDALRAGRIHTSLIPRLADATLHSEPGTSLRPAKVS